VKPIYNGKNKGHKFFWRRKVPFTTGTLILDPWEYKTFLLKRGFHYAQVPFKAGFIVYGLLLMKRTEFT